MALGVVLHVVLVGSIFLHTPRARAFVHRVPAIMSDISLTLEKMTVIIFTEFSEFGS